MTTNRLMAGGRPIGRDSAPRSRPRSPSLALLGLALVALIQAGCRSDGCTNCNLGSKLTNGVQALTARVTGHFSNCGGAVAGGDCGCGIGGVGGETVIDSGIPVVPGGIVYPGAGQVIQAPPMEQPPTQLDAIPSQPTSSKGSASPSSKTSTPSGTNSSSYTAMAPKGALAQRRGVDVSRAVHSSPENLGTIDLLEHLPPVDLPSEVTSNAAATPKAVAKPDAPATQSASPTASTPSPGPSPAPAQDNTTPTSAEKVSAAEGAVGPSITFEPPTSPGTPGIRHYASIAPYVGGGSAPTLEGLDWLKNKGYRTFIDLRKPSEVDPNFVEAVSDRNMDYVSLSILANRLEPSRLARFDDLISRSDNRLLFFCDSDGSLAGLVWYIHLRVVAQEDPDSATSKAEEIGLTSDGARLAEAYLAVHKPRSRTSTSKVASASPIETREIKVEPTSAPVAASASSLPNPAPRSALPGGPSPTATDLNPGGSPSGTTHPMLPGEDRPQASNPAAPGTNRLRDPAFWRPVAALVLTGIGVPLAYWSRSAFTVSKTLRARASLPGAVLQPTELPTGSDA